MVNCDLMSPADTDSSQHDPEISLFLLLCAEHHRLVEGIMAECRRIVPSDPFIPHMTMYFGSGAPSGGIRSLVEAVALSTGPVTQKILSISGEDRFWRASYIALSGGVEVDNMNRLLKNGIVNYGSYSHFPHVSLVYAHAIAPAQLTEIREVAGERLRLAGVEALVFDKVAMFQRSSPNGAWEDVSRWREICSASLSGGY